MVNLMGDVDDSHVDGNRKSLAWIGMNIVTFERKSTTLTKELNGSRLRRRLRAIYRAVFIYFQLVFVNATFSFVKIHLGSLFPFDESVSRQNE